MADYGRAIKRSFSDIKALAIGAIMALVGMFIMITLLPFWGYLLKCAESASKGNFALPEWTDWGGLFVKGILAFIIGFIYMIPVAIVAFIVFASLFVSMASLDMGAMSAAFAGSLIGAFAIFILALLAAFLLPLALTKYAIEGNFGAAFSLKTILKKAFTGSYIITWIIMGLFCFILTSVLSIIPFIGTAVGMFIGYVAFFTAIGEIYNTL